MKTSICIFAAALLAASPGLAASATSSSPAKSSTRAKPPVKSESKPKAAAPARKASPKAVSAKKPLSKKPVPKKAASRKAASRKAPAGQVYASGRCRLAIPKGWSDFHGGKADPKDRGFGVTMGRMADARSMTATLKAMHGRVISDKGDVTLVQVEARGRAAKQYWALTKTGPGCRATVTFSDSAQEASARKIAESLKKEK